MLTVKKILLQGATVHLWRVHISSHTHLVGEDTTLVGFNVERSHLHVDARHNWAKPLDHLDFRKPQADE